MDAIKMLQEQASITADSKAIKLTHNITFSAPKIAEVSKDDLLAAVSKVLKSKYPDNYFLTAYHSNTPNPHVHVVFSINNSEGKRIDIRKNDLRSLREDFCQILIEFGYQVKATHKFHADHQEYKSLQVCNRDIYQVVDFGCASYKLDKKNNDNNYLVYRTLNSPKEITIWGKEIVAALQRNQVQIGDLIKIKKTGETEVDVPVYDKSGANITSWRKAKRNQWEIKNMKLDYPHDTQENLETNSLDSFEPNSKQLENKQKFLHEKELLLGTKNQEELKLQSNYQYKY